MTRRLLPCGEHAVLVELDGLAAVIALDDAVRAAVESGDAAFAGVVDVIPAARTLLLVVGENDTLGPVRQGLSTLIGRLGSGAPADVSRPGRLEVVEIAVHYDGPDLQEVSRVTGLATREVVAAHTALPWRTAFAGFSPGFAYLTGGDTRLQVPRRDEPRTAVPAGSVALAGEFSAVYPRSTPGGWQLLGRTDAVLWDVDGQPPALLQPGSTVRFVDADADRGLA